MVNDGAPHDLPDIVSQQATPLEQIIYWVVANRDDFDVPKFRSALPKPFREKDDLDVFVASEGESEPRYHALFGWTITEEEVSLNIEYTVAPPPPGLDEEKDDSETDGPPAEGLMPWLGQFFATESITSHAHARFRFPVDSRQTTFELSLAGEAPHDARLYGVALQLPTRPDGVVSVRLTRGGSDWYAELISDREVVFRDFSVSDESQRLASFLSSFLKETRQ